MFVTVLLSETTERAVYHSARIGLILVGAFILNRLMRRAIRRFVAGITGETAQGRFSRLRGRTPNLLRSTGESPTLRAAARAKTIGSVLRSVATLVIYTIAILLVLGELNINLAPLIAGAGVVGIALGFGAQSLVKDFLSGIFMLIEDQYGVGDIVDVGEANGVVEAVTLRSTRLRDVNGTVWHVPNGEIRRVGNKSQQWARALIDVAVAYGTDIRHATSVIKRVADEVWREPEWSQKILEEPAVWGVETLGVDGIAIRLVVKTLPAEQFDVMRELRLRLKEAFVEEGIELPFAQRMLWVRQEEEQDGPAVTPKKVKRRSSASDRSTPRTPP
ncbi:MAG: mechanosensitive ion channel family protein [Acidimicrobiales bacterium]